MDTFPDRTAPALFLRDRDVIYGDSFRPRVRGMQIQEVHTSSPKPVAEFLRGTPDRRHLRNILTGHLEYYHHTRTHLFLTKDAPDGTPIEPP